jgi:hypothetical protein
MKNNDFPLTVTENKNGTFTLDWDSEHPATSIMNDWSEEDFHAVIELGLTEWQLEAEDRALRTEFDVLEFADNFDELFDRVENGETLTIVNTDGQKVLMMPTDQLPNV